MGGNGPLMATGLGHLGTKIYFVGAVGWPTVDPIFDPLKQFGELITMTTNCLTDAAEFEDGKLLYGQMESYKTIRWNHLLECVGGKEKLTEELANCQLIAMTNWTMIPFSNEIYEGLANLVAEANYLKPPKFFVDLADPRKRTREDLQCVIQLLSGIDDRGLTMILGLNHAEGLQVAEVLGIDDAPKGDDPDSLMALATAVREKSGLTEVVVHPRARAASSTADGAWCVEGPFTANPLISTGAGDHFNGGYCHGRLQDLSPEMSLMVGVATSGYYVRNAVGPNPDQMEQFLKNWAEQTPA